MMIDSFFKAVRGIVKLRGSDGTIIGNTGDRLKSESAIIGYSSTSGQFKNVAVDDSGAIITSGTFNLISPLPAATIINQQSINSGATIFTSYTAIQKLAIKQFYAGGTGIGKQELFVYVPTATQFVTNGDFESSAQVTPWVYSTTGASGTTVAFSTAQKFTGSGSLALTFSTSDSNHNHVLTQTFSTPQDFSAWRSISARFYQVPPASAVTRTLQIVLTDSSAASRTFTLSGLTTSAPFNVTGWVQINGDIANPSSSSGTSFDVTAITSIALKFFDSASRTGTVYWDAVQLVGSLSPIFPIYHQANSSFNIVVDPVVLLNIGNQVLISQTNNDTVRKEFYALVGAVGVS